jgi:hypothetical protein
VRARACVCVWRRIHMGDALRNPISVEFQVKSSQVKSNSKWRSPVRLLWCPSLARAIGRAELGATGTTGYKPRVGASSPSSCSCILIIAVSTRRPRASTSCLFQEVYTVRQCNTAPGRRWERSGACASARVLLRWAEEMPVGSGRDRR